MDATESAVKIFEKSEYDECDLKAKACITGWLARHGVVDAETHERKGIDIVATDNKEKISYHEVEVKKVWRGKWPDEWPTVHIPARKKKLLGHKPLHFWVIAGDFIHAWRIESKHLRDKYLVMVPNKKIRYGEYFYCIPVELCKLINLAPR